MTSWPMVAALGVVDHVLQSGFEGIVGLAQLGTESRDSLPYAGQFQGVAPGRAGPGFRDGLSQRLAVSL